MKKFLTTSKNVQKSSYIWNMVGSLLNAFQSVVFLMILTRTLGIAEAGIFTIAYANASLFLNIGRYGMRNFQVSDYKNQFSFDQYRTSRYVTTGLMGLVSVAYLIWAANANGYSLHKSLIILWMCVWKMVDALEDIFHGDLQQHGRLDVASKMLTIRIVTMELVWLLLLAITHNQVIATAGGAIYSLVLVLWMLSLISENLSTNEILPAKKESLKSIAPLLKTTFPLFISLFLAFYIGNAPKYAIDAQLSDELQACYGFIAMPVFVIGLLNNFVFNPILSGMSKLWSDHRVFEFLKRSLLQMLVVVGITAVCLVGAWLIGIPVLSWLYNTDLTDYRVDLMIMLVGGGFLGLSGLLQTLITIVRFQRSLMLGYALIALFALLLSDPVVGKFSIHGAAILYVFLMGILCVVFTMLFMYGVWKGKKESKEFANAGGSKG